MTPPFAVIALGIAIPLGILAAAVYRERRRREALEEYCQIRGFRFDRDRPGAEEALSPAFAIFQRGYGNSWGTTLSGQVGGRPFTAFEYTYVSGGGRNRQRNRYAMMLWQAPGVSLPRFSLAPEGFFRRLAQRFGAKDFDFEGDDEFSRGYELQGDDEAAVRALFTQALRAFLVTPGPDGRAGPRHHLAGAGTQLLWWRRGRLPRPDALDQFIADGDALRRLFLEDCND